MLNEDRLHDEHEQNCENVELNERFIEFEKVNDSLRSSIRLNLTSKRFSYQVYSLPKLTDLKAELNESL